MTCGETLLVLPTRLDVLSGLPVPRRSHAEPLRADADARPQRPIEKLFFDERVDQVGPVFELQDPLLPQGVIDPSPHPLGADVPVAAVLELQHQRAAKVARVIPRVGVNAACGAHCDLTLQHTMPKSRGNGAVAYDSLRPETPVLRRRLRGESERRPRGRADRANSLHATSIAGARPPVKLAHQAAETDRHQVPAAF